MMRKIISNQRGFALIVSLLMLFALTVLGIMVMNSAEQEVVLTGAQQRYEQSFALLEGASNTEGSILDNDLTVTYTGETFERRYVVTNPGQLDAVVSPQEADGDLFDPYDDIVVEPSSGTPSALGDVTTWPSDRLLPGDEITSYRYFIIYQDWDTVRKGYDASTKGEMAEYRFQVQVAGWDLNTQTTNRIIETGNYRIGTKPTN